MTILEETGRCHEQEGNAMPDLEDVDVGTARPDSVQHIRVEPSPRRVRAFLDNVAVADSKRFLLLFERGHLPTYYFPPEDVRMDLLEPTQRTTHCPYKGDASYWTVRVGDRTSENAAWGYPEPLPDRGDIKGDVAWSYPAPIPECPKVEQFVAFFNERVDLYVDGELQPRPKTPWS